MSDFLSSLAARALSNATDALPLLQPRLRARFEPPDLAGTLLEQFESESSAAAPPAAPSTAPVVASEPVPLRVPTVAQLPQAAPEQPPVQLASAPKHDAPLAPAQFEQIIALPAQARVATVRPASNEPLYEATTTANVSLPSTPVQAATPPAASAATPPQRAAPPAPPQPVRPAPAAIPVTVLRAPPAAPEREAAPPPEPLIQVTIGRIEVRASAPPAAPHSRPASEGSSLAEYLRKGGER